MAAATMMVVPDVNIKNDDDIEDLTTITTKTKAKGCCSYTKDFLLYNSSTPLNQALYLNQFGRAMLFITFMFLSLGVLQLANKQANCPTVTDDVTGKISYTNCGNKVYGMLPSSVLSLMAIIGGVATSCFMPYAGAVVDFSDHRLEFGKVAASLLVLITFLPIFLFERTWFALVLIHSSIGSATFMANSMVLWSYVRADTDHDLHGVMASARVWETFGMLSFFIVVGAVQLVSKWDSVVVARFSQAFATTVGGTSLYLAYRRYGPVKAVKTLPKKADGVTNMNLYVAGVSELKTTLLSLHKTHPSAARFLLGSIFIEASISSFTNLAISYLSAQIGMSATEITIFILINLACNPFGILFHRSFARKVGHKRSYLACQVYLLVLTPIMVVVIDSPARTNLAYLFGVLFGISYGWYYPASNGYYVALVPEEKVSELWGLNSLCSVILSWVPPLIFAVLNETTGKIQVGWVGVILFELIGLIISFTIPEETKSNDEGKEVNRRDSEEAFKKFEQEISVIEKGHDDE